MHHVFLPLPKMITIPSRTSRPPISPGRSLFLESDQLSNCFTQDDEKSVILTFVIIDLLQYFKGNLQYDQGFHNIGAIFLLTHGKISLTMSTLKMVASLYLRETMQPNFEMLKEGVELFYPKSPGFPIKSIILQKICLITIATHCYTLN